MSDPIASYYSYIHVGFFLAFYGTVFAFFKHEFGQVAKEYKNEEVNNNKSVNHNKSVKYQKSRKLTVNDSFAIRFTVNECLIDLYLDEDIFNLTNLDDEIYSSYGITLYSCLAVWNSGLCRNLLTATQAEVIR